MRALAPVVLALLVASGCSNPMHFFSLEEYGQGWELKVEEKGETFRASWVKGKHRSTKLANYHEAPGGSYLVINTLFLELEPSGNVAKGWLKRWTTPEFSRRAFSERHAKWFRVLGGSCVLDAEGNGTLDVKCEGDYTFTGDVVPDDNMLVKKSE